MARNHGVEVELEHAVEHVGPVEKAAALSIVDIDVDAWRSIRVLPGRRGTSEEQVARVNDAEVRKIDDGVAVRMTAAEPQRPCLDVAEVDRKLVGENEIREPDRQARIVLIVRLPDVRQVGTNVLVGNDVGDRQQLQIATGMIVVLVRIELVDDRLIGDRCDGGQNIVMVPVEHIIDEHDAVVGHIGRDVAAFAGDHVELALDALDRQLRGRAKALGIRRARDVGRADCGENNDSGSRPHRSDHAMP